MQALVALLHDEATLSMPLRAVDAGPRRDRAVDGRSGRRVPRVTDGARAGERDLRLRSVPDLPDGGYDAWALQVIDTSGARSPGSTRSSTSPRGSRSSACPAPGRVRRGPAGA
ncbi:hypothetical protein NKG05_13845 [Oerskovia sp. M15]